MPAIARQRDSERYDEGRLTAFFDRVMNDTSSRWKITADDRRRVIDKLLSVIDDETVEPRHLAMAIRLFLEIDRDDFLSRAKLVELAQAGDRQHRNVEDVIGKLPPHLWKEIDQVPRLARTGPAIPDGDEDDVE